jgi:hypothetical protein
MNLAFSKHYGAKALKYVMRSDAKKRFGLFVIAFVIAAPLAWYLM